MVFSLRMQVILATLLAVAVGLLVAGWLALDSLQEWELTRIVEDLEARNRLAQASFSGVDHDSSQSPRGRGFEGERLAGRTQGDFPAHVTSGLEHRGRQLI